jgi:hypothetical protein
MAHTQQNTKDFINQHNSYFVVPMLQALRQALESQSWTQIHFIKTQGTELELTKHERFGSIGERKEVWSLMGGVL